MNTETLAANLRNAISSGDRYHIELYGEEACRRLMQQQRALDALKKRQDAARGAISDGRDTEPATDETARETANKRGTCENCKWFERDESSNSYEWDGECHRYPEWSTHDDDDWCGEWEKRPLWCEVER